MIHFQRGVNERAFLDTDDDTKSQEGSLDFWQLSPPNFYGQCKRVFVKAFLMSSMYVVAKELCFVFFNVIALHILLSLLSPLLD